MPMTNDDLVRALEWCRKELRAYGSTNPGNTKSSNVSINGRLCHAAWMATEALSFAATKPQKAHRWLGFIQGVLWCHGGISIDEMKGANRPEGEE